MKAASYLCSCVLGKTVSKCVQFHRCGKIHAMQCTSLRCQTVAARGSQFQSRGQSRVGYQQVIEDCLFSKVTMFVASRDCTMRNSIFHVLYVVDVLVTWSTAHQSILSTEIRPSP